MSSLNPGRSENTASSSAVDMENERLARKYCPLVVLFPEIADNSKREDHHRTGHSLGSEPPLDQDYHPRDIRLVLDNARPPSIRLSKYLKMRKKTSREQLLDAMSQNKIKYIILIDEQGPKNASKFWSAYSKIENKDNNPEYHRKAYARVIRGSGRFAKYISIQYWLVWCLSNNLTIV